jgi:hypothetical protein
MPRPSRNPNIPNHIMTTNLNSLRLPTLAVVFSTAFALSADAASIVAGSMSVTYDQTTFASLFLTTNDHFGQASSNSLDLTTITSPGTPGDSTDVWSGLAFGVNGASITSPDPFRALQSTSFTYNPANLTGSASGQIGLGGFTRFNGFGGLFYIGDYQLRFDGSRTSGVYSGWYLQNNAGFPANAFDLANVTTTVGAEGFELSGDLVPNSDSFFALYGLTGADMGNFSFTGSTVPEPSAAILGACSLLGLLARRRRNS